MLQVIDRMANNLWSNLDIPDVWGNYSNYRGLTIRLIVYKLIININLERIRLWYEAQLSKKQNGFRKNRGTTDGTYSMKRIHQISNRQKQPLYLLCVDLTAAFDRIPRKWLFSSI